MLVRSDVTFWKMEFARGHFYHSLKIIELVSVLVAQVLSQNPEEF